LKWRRRDGVALLRLAALPGAAPELEVVEVELLGGRYVAIVAARFGSSHGSR
jgi:hypothetical protein